MVIVDTSVWIDHFRNSNRVLSGLLQDGNVMCHPFIVGELACGNLTNREEVLSLLMTIPQARTAEDYEILHFIEENKLMGLGVGLIDVHLLSSALIEGVRLWTSDKRLVKLAVELNISYKRTNQGF